MTSISPEALEENHPHLSHLLGLPGVSRLTAAMLQSLPPSSRDHHLQVSAHSSGLSPIKHLSLDLGSTWVILGDVFSCFFSAFYLFFFKPFYFFFFNLIFF